MAQPGEYTKRAFMNGKMDLIKQGGGRPYRLQLGSISSCCHESDEGGFSRELADLRASLLKFVSLIELELDFSTEDVEFCRQTTVDRLGAHHSAQNKSSVRFIRLGNAIKTVFPLPWWEKPTWVNPLLNWLLNEDKAIVSDVKGTTRDVMKTLFIWGVQFRLIDTAGLDQRQSGKMGIEHKYKKWKASSCF